MVADTRRTVSLRTRAGMRCTRILACAAVMLAGWLSAAPCAAQTSGGTLWDFLGIPTNAAAQASSNPAIAAAAQAKAAKHEICKKKKALQYLAGMGCSPEHPEVAAALLAAMGDPDEPVRYEAVKAVMQTAEGCQSNEQKRQSRKALSLGERCHDCKKKIDKAICDCIDRLCGKAPPKEHKHKLKSLLGRDDCPQEPADCGKGSGSCCTPEIREKLQQLAYGRDDRGCFLERSTRIRELAAAALQACAACGGCGCRDGNASNAMREMPPEEAREMPREATDPLLDGDCVYESVIVPMPAAGQPTLADPLPPEPPSLPPPSGHGPPAPEPIPTPAASLAAPPARLAMVPGAGAAVPNLPLPPRTTVQAPPPRPSQLWAPLPPAETIARAAAAPPSLGTRPLESAIARLPGPMPVARRIPTPAAVPAAAPSAAADAPEPASLAHWPLRGVAIVLTIVATCGALADAFARQSQRRRHRHEQRGGNPA